MVQIKRNFEEMISRHKAYFEMKPVKRSLYGVTIMGRGYAEAYSNTFSKIQKKVEVKPGDIDLESFIKDVEKFLKWHEEAGFDFFYPISPFSYIPWIEAIIGCPIFAGKDSFYAEPASGCWPDVPDKIDLSEKNKWFAKLLEMTEALVNEFGGHVPIASSTHLRGPADMMSAAIGQRQYIFEIFDNPQKLRKLGNICTEAFIETATTVNQIVSKAKFKGYVTNNFGVYTEKVCQHYQDDAVAFLSPKYYKEFILEKHIEIDESFDSTLYHVHPISMFVVDELVRFPRLKIIEINREPVAIGPAMKDMIPVFKKIQENKKAVVAHFPDIDFAPELIEQEVALICQNLSYEGLFINVCAENVEDALLKTERIRKSFDI